jgi:hypothetical protein
VHDNMKGFKWVEHFFLVKFLYVLIQIQKHRNGVKHFELSVLSVLDLAWYLVLDILVGQ